MRRRGRGAVRSGLTVTVVWSFVVGAVVAVPATVAGAVEAADAPQWVEDLVLRRPAVAGSTAVEDLGESEPAPLGSSEGGDPLPEPELPEARAWSVTLGDDGDTATRASGTVGPVAVAAAADGFDGDRLRIEVLDEAVAERAGVRGFVFGVSEQAERGDEGAFRQAAAADDTLPADLTVDYSGFTTAYGGGYAARLRIVALPDCVLVDPLPDGCPTAGVPVPTTNDREAEELRVEVEDLAALAVDGVTVPTPAGRRGDVGELGEVAAGSDIAAAGPSGLLLAVAAAPGSEEGTYSATPVSVAGQWQVAPGSGEFSHTYDFDVPPPAGGTAPSVSMSYSSGAVDGLTNATNTQASMSGVGWSQFGGFIERRYDSCVETLESQDLCWINQNATISLGGVSGPLLPLDTGSTQWAVRSDPGWKVERLTGANNGDGGGADGQGEHWKVTATDGTQYFFGLGQNPDFPEATNSTATAPVFADHAADPCFDPALDWGICKNQAWRWNLDRIVDPDGNVTSFFYTRNQNRYGAGNGLFNGEVYDRSAELARIDYGAHTGPAAADKLQATVRIELFRPPRCFTLLDDCPAPTGQNGLGFPDVPSDFICNAGQTCSSHTPTFFETTRYSYLKTRVRVGSAFKDVARYNLYHRFLPETGSPQKMYLQAIQQVGLTDTSLPLGFPMPDTSFEYTMLANRVDLDPGRGQVPMPHGRLTKVTNQLGGVVEVTYGQNRPCPLNYRPAVWTANDRDCFPQSIVDATTRRTGVFNKYLVTRTVERATPSLTNPITTDHTYEGTPLWAFNNGSFAQYDMEWGWSGWRGYGTSRVTQGTSVRRVRVFRGMDGDPLWLHDEGGDHCVCGEREETVTTFNEATTVPDHPVLAGRVLEEAQLGTLDGVAEVRLQSTTYGYARLQTHAPGPSELRGAEWAAVETVTDTMATSPTQFRSQRTTTGYDLAHEPVPRAVTSYEEGWLDVTGDERCTRTTYADNAARWMFEYPASEVVVAGGCSSTQELSATQTYYDGSTTLGALPSRGNPTRQRTKLDGTIWATTLTGYDNLGRATSVTDANGGTTTTTYEATPAHAIPTRTTSTNVRGHSHVTDFMPEHQVPVRETDPNGNVTTYSYDGLGRLFNVALPTEQQPGMLEFFPSWAFRYTIDRASGRTAVKAMQMTSFRTVPGGGEASYEETWTIYDGLGREWQTQQRSPQSGRVLVSETAYDGRGLVLHEAGPQAVPGTLGTLALVSWSNRTRHAYDALQREVRQEWMQGESVARTTEMAYTADTLTVTGPDGSRVRETSDAFGRTTQVAEHDGQSWVASNYTYDLADNLLTIDDPQGNRTTYTYDLAGRRLTESDPDRGTRSFGYDAAGNQTWVTDGLGNAVHTVYDNVGRPTHRRSGSATGPVLATWAYDTLQRGELDRTTSVTPTGTWTTDVTGYDRRGRPTGTRLTAPSGIPGISGVDYTTTQGYDLADRVTSITYPAVGGLPQETVTTTYDALGLPTGMTSPLAPYVRTTTHDDRGRLTAAAFGPAASGGGPWLAKGWSFDADQQPAAVETFVAGASAPNGIVSRHELAYDDAGNLADRATTLAGESWRECFEHDDRQRLTRAFTVERADTCAEGQAGTGDQPYEHRFTHHPDGRVATRSEAVDPDPGDVVTYGYPAPGQARPHAPTAVGADTYAWDGNGNLASRTVGGTAETFTWDVQHQLASIQGPGGTTGFSYDADGNRLLRRTPAGATLYLAGHEITANAAGTSVTAVRTYAFEGQLVATRTPAGLEYLVSDEAGSVEMTVPAGGQPDAHRSYEPYGQVRAEAGTMATDRGFVGEVEDGTTGLSFLRNRYYDPTIGLFTSPDPIYDTAEVQSLNPYTYGRSNPTTMADPDGLSPVYIHGLEMQNRGLRDQNRQLRSHITRLESHIEQLQGIVRKQSRVINRMMSQIRTLENVVRQQQATIRRLVNRVNYLVGVVNAQRVVIGRLQAKVAAQARIIRAQNWIIAYQRGVISYQNFVIVQMVGYFWRTPVQQRAVLHTIANGTFRHPVSVFPAWMIGEDFREAYAYETGVSEALAGEIESLERRNRSLQRQMDSVGDPPSAEEATDAEVLQNVCSLVADLDILVGAAELRGRGVAGSQYLYAAEFLCHIGSP